LKADAKVLCNSYAPKTWASLGKNASLYDVMPVIQKQAYTHLKTTEFKHAIDGSTSRNFESYYSSTKKRIASLIGHSWNCQAFDDFFHPKIVVVPVMLGKHQSVPIAFPSKHNLYVEIINDQQISIDRARLNKFEPDYIMKGLELKLKSKAQDVKLIVSIDPSVSYSKINQFLKVLDALKIHQFSLVMASTEGN
jgi:biopolymer transport protein ExbD